MFSGVAISNKWYRNTIEITFCIRKQCDRFLEEELKEWSEFDIEAMGSDINVDMDPHATLTKKHKAIHHPHSPQVIKSEYAEINYTVKQKPKQGSVSTFSNMLAAALVKM